MNINIDYSRSKLNIHGLNNRHIIYLFNERKNRICKNAKYLTYYILYYDEYNMFVRKNEDEFEIDDVVEIANKELMFLKCNENY